MPPLILLFSPQLRVQEILVTGLFQCDFRVVATVSPFLAVMNATKHPVDLLIVDMPLIDTRGMMIIRAFKKSKVLNAIPILVLVPGEPKNFLDKLSAEYFDEHHECVFLKSSILIYPFNFIELVKKANELVGRAES